MLTLMLWVQSHLLPALFSYAFIGAVLMIADRYIGIPTYRAYYNRGKGPDDPSMPTEGPEVRGWLYNVPLKNLHNRSLFLSAVLSVAAMAIWHYTAWEKTAELFAWVLEAWAMFPGYWLGNMIYDKVILRQERIFNAIEYRGEVAAGWRSWAMGMFAGMKKSGPQSTSMQPKAAAPSQEQAAPQAPAPAPKGMSASDILKRHADGRRV